jgi:hypothetical protein
MERQAQSVLALSLTSYLGPPPQARRAVLTTSALSSQTHQFSDDRDCWVQGVEAHVHVVIEKSLFSSPRPGTWGEYKNNILTTMRLNPNVNLPCPRPHSAAPRKILQGLVTGTGISGL